LQQLSAQTNMHPGSTLRLLMPFIATGPGEAGLLAGGAVGVDLFHEPQEVIELGLVGAVARKARGQRRTNNGRMEVP
jgi:hypothetical protein